MFKYASVEEELIQSMQKQLKANDFEKNHKFIKIAQAIEYVKAAADIFDNADMSEEVDELTNILINLQGQNDK
jgi:hypothetical protein